MNVPGGLSRVLPVIGVEPGNLGLAELRRTADDCPLWLLDLAHLNPYTIRRF
jgi:hypothetical protein